MHTNESGSENTRKSVSIIVPAWNAEATLRQVLEPLLPLPDNWDIVVVDDHSTDETVAIAQSLGVRVVPSNWHRSSLKARNTGVALSRGNILVFIDADIVTCIDDLRRGIERLPEDENACLFGVYDRGDHLGNTVSRYKNFWIRHSTLASPPPFRWLNSSLIIIPRTLLNKSGGFLGNFLCSHGGEDLDLGRRIAEIGGTILLDRHLEITHLKHFTLRRLWINDLQRARGWLRHSLAIKGWASVIRSPSLANVSPDFSWAVVATTSAVPTAVLSICWPPFAILSSASLLGGVLLNFSFLREAFMEKIRGRYLFIPLLWLDQLACGLGICLEIISRIPWRKTRLADCPVRDED